jgi:hypothetical protein
LPCGGDLAAGACTASQFRRALSTDETERLRVLEKKIAAIRIPPPAIYGVNIEGLRPVFSRPLNRVDNPVKRGRLTQLSQHLHCNHQRSRLRAAVE